MKRSLDQPSRPLVEQAIDDLSAILRLRTYLAPPAWGELNLTIGQLQVLMKLRRFGPVPMHRIAEWAASRPASATSVVDRLERHGLVERVHPEADRQIVEARLTPEGTHLIDEVLGVRRDGFRAVFDALDDAQLAELHRLLSRVIAAGETLAAREAPRALPRDRDEGAVDPDRSQPTPGASR